MMESLASNGQMSNNLATNTSASNQHMNLISNVKSNKRHFSSGSTSSLQNSGKSLILR
jgi:hypothetical protein